MSEPATVRLTVGQVAESTPVEIGGEQLVTLGRVDERVEVFHPVKGIGHCAKDTPVTEIVEPESREQLLRAALAMVNDERMSAIAAGQLLELIVVAAMDQLATQPSDITGDAPEVVEAAIA